MVRIGSCAPRSATKRTVDVRPGVERNRHRARTWVEPSIFFGVKTGESKPRWTSWSGGSSKITNLMGSRSRP